MTDEVVPSGVLDERDSASIGVVEAVSPSRIDVAILREAPHGTGMRQGTFHRFPRINSYVVLPSERGSILAVVTWVGIDADSSTDLRQPDQIGLPVPRRRLRALPLGVLRRAASLLDGGEPLIELDRGVLVFPTVGDPVRLPTKAEARSAVPVARDDALVVPIGKAPLAGDADLCVDPNRLFGRHLAVLGNTGSGKSCSVAQILRASATSAGPSLKSFRAVVLDLNGEYRTAFDGLENGVDVRHFTVVPGEPGIAQLRVPYWLWNYREWLSFSEASARSQAPQLRRCLHLLRTSNLGDVPRAVVGLVAGRRVVRQYEAGAVDPKSNSDCLSALDNVISACEIVESTSGPEVKSALQQVRASIAAVLNSRRGSGEYIWKYGAHQLNHQECASLLPLLDTAIEALGLPEFLGDGMTVDSPVPFDAANLIELLPLMAADSGPEVVGWVAPLVERLHIAMADRRLASIAGWIADESVADWLRSYLSDGDRSQITVIDLSLVPTHVLHLVAAVFARMLLEAHERSRQAEQGGLQPTVLVVEEAHTLVRRHVGASDEEAAVPAVRLCREAFERIAREGRKFGLSLVVSSQRPSELSETVLSQCNTFLIHRLVNDHDQNLVRRLVPDSLGELTEELPALPSQTALMVGWAIEVPTLVRVADLDEKYRPKSSDPDYARTWTGQVAAVADWGRVADRWIHPLDDQPGADVSSDLMQDDRSGIGDEDFTGDSTGDDEPPF